MSTIFVLFHSWVSYPWTGARRTGDGNLGAVLLEANLGAVLCELGLGEVAGRFVYPLARDRGTRQLRYHGIFIRGLLFAAPTIILLNVWPF